MPVIECAYEPPHVHEYPDDWEFAGANGLDPRADPRWVNVTYVYLDESLHEVWTSQTALCLDEAIDDFTKHREFKPKYLQRRVAREKIELLPYEYDAATDTVTDL